MRVSAPFDLYICTEPGCYKAFGHLSPHDHASLATGEQMSFGKTFTTREAFEANQPASHYGYDNQSPEVLEAIDEVENKVREHVLDFIYSGVLGKDKDFSISFNGHCNANHEPVNGMSRDFVNISINQRAEAAPRPADATDTPVGSGG